MVIAPFDGPAELGRAASRRRTSAVPLRELALVRVLSKGMPGIYSDAEVPGGFEGAEVGH
jgi:hypothetical protein